MLLGGFMPLYPTEKVEVTLPADTCAPKNVFNDKNRQWIVSRYNHRTRNAWLGENHMVAMLPCKRKSFNFQDTHKLTVRYRGDPGHRLASRGHWNCQPQLLADNNLMRLVEVSASFEPSL